MTHTYQWTRNQAEMNLIFCFVNFLSLNSNSPQSWLFTGDITFKRRPIVFIRSSNKLSPCCFYSWVRHRPTHSVAWLSSKGKSPHPPVSWTTCALPLSAFHNQSFGKIVMTTRWTSAQMLCQKLLKSERMQWQTTAKNAYPSQHLLLYVKLFWSPRPTCAMWMKSNLAVSKAVPRWLFSSIESPGAPLQRR